MNIVLFSTSLKGGGDERIIQLLSDYLISRGHKVTIACLDSGSPSYRFAKDVNLIYFKTGLFNKGILKILLLPLQALELLRILRKVKPDATISFLVRANLVNALSKHENDKRSVIISHRNITHGLYGKYSIKDRVMLRLIKTLYNRADQIISISEDVRMSLEAIGINSHKMTIIPNFVSFRVVEQSIGASYRIPQDKPIIVSVGRLIEQKDYPTLLRAFAKVRLAVDARLVIIGEGPLRQKLADLAAQLEIAGDVMFTGWLDNPFEVMRQSSLFVLCSLYEGFGNVIIEAMACGLPIICTNCPGGPAKILDNGRYGKLVDIGDIEGVAAGILDVLGQPEVSQRMKQQSAVRVKAYDVKNIALQYLHVMETSRQLQTAAK